MNMQTASRTRLAYKLAYNLIRQQTETYRTIPSEKYTDNNRQLLRLKVWFPEAVNAARQSLRIRDRYTPMTDFKVALRHRATVARAVANANDTAANEAALYTVAVSVWDAGLPSVTTTRCATIAQARKVLQRDWKYLSRRTNAHLMISNGYTLANLPADMVKTQTARLGRFTAGRVSWVGGKAELVIIALKQ